MQEAGKAAGPQADQLGLADFRDAVMAASIAAEPEGARLKGVIMGAPNDVATEFSPTLTETVPADALAYVGFSNLSGTLTQVFQQVQGSLGEEQKRSSRASPASCRSSSASRSTTSRRSPRRSTPSS